MWPNEVPSCQGRLTTMLSGILGWIRLAKLYKLLLISGYKLISSEFSESNINDPSTLCGKIRYEIPKMREKG